MNRPLVCRRTALYIGPAAERNRSALTNMAGQSSVIATGEGGATAASEQPRDPRLREAGWLRFVLVLLLVLIGHAWSIDTGLYLDDYAHYEHLRDGDWSYRSAVDAARLGIVGEVLDLWGRQEAGLRFYRPIAFWVMRAEYTVGRWQPLPMHCFSLGWHLACALLVGALATRCLGRPGWGTVAAGFTALHPGHVSTVYWIACQTELLTTVLLLLGVLAYARHAAWGWRQVPERGGWVWQPWFLPRDRGSSWWTPRSGPELRTVSPWALIAVLCYAAALGCRENAMLFPLVCWLGDRLIGSPRRRRFRIEHALMAFAAAAYLALRYEALGGFPVPPEPYLTRFAPTLEYARFVAYKVAMYVLGLFCFVPVVPIGSRNFFDDRPMALYGTTLAVIGLLLVVWRAYRWRAGLLWPMVWIACLIAPVIPVFASPHHLYLPGVGTALLWTAGLAAIGGLLAAHVGRLRWLLTIVILTLASAALGVGAWSMGFIFVRGTMTENAVVRNVLSGVRPVREGDHLFFINLSPLAYYAVPAIEHETGFRQLNGHVLTFAPDMMRMQGASEVSVEGERRLRLRAAPGEGYLSGIMGRMLRGMMSLPEIEVGRPVDAGHFTVTPLEVGPSGVTEMVFDFPKPLDSPNYHFYLGSPQFMAYSLDMSQLVSLNRNGYASKTGEPMKK